MAGKFIECVIIAGSNWIHATELEIYISNNLAYDDVAYLTPSVETHDLLPKVQPKVKYTTE